MITEGTQQILTVLYPLYKDEVYKRREQMMKLTTFGSFGLMAMIFSLLLNPLKGRLSFPEIVVLGLAAVIWSVAVHSPTHWVVGRVFGMRFRCYFFGGPFPPRPGLKTDYASYLRTPARRRAWMHASGALATKAAPFVALAFWPATDASAWAAALVFLIGVVQILTDVLLSTKSSDWKKVKRELAAARRSA